MPNIMEISGLLSGGRGLAFPAAQGISDLRQALGAGRKRRKKARKVKKTRRKKARKARVRTPSVPKVGVRRVGPSCERMLEIAEAQYAKGNKALALAWGSRAIKCAKAEGKPAVGQRAQELVKQIRGEAILKTAAGLNDVEAVYLGRVLGLF